MTSILSSQPDGCGYFYGFTKGDCRQINVRYENNFWLAYVGDDEVSGPHISKHFAEAAAIKWAKENPCS